MKKHFVLLVCLITIIALFVSCTDNVAEDTLGTLSIKGFSDSEPLAKGISATTVIPTTTNLKWEYAATKTAGFFKSGETTWTNLDFTKTIKLSVKSTWTIEIRGFASDDPAKTIIYQGSKTGIVLSESDDEESPKVISIPVFSQLTKGKVNFGVITYSPYTPTNTNYDNTEVKLIVKEGDTIIAPKDATTASNGFPATISNGVAKFDLSSEDAMEYENGSHHVYVFEVYDADGKEKISSDCMFSFLIYNGYTVTISGDMEAFSKDGYLKIGQNKVCLETTSSTQFLSLASATNTSPAENLVLLDNISDDSVSKNVTVKLNKASLTDVTVPSGTNLTIVPHSGSSYVFTNGKISFTANGYDMTINTVGGTLTIDAPADTVHHTGTADVVDVNAVASNSYHVEGDIKVLNVKKGRVVVEDVAAAKVATINVESTTDVKIEVNDATKVAQVSSKTLAEDEVKKVIFGDAKDKIEESLVVEADAKVKIGDVLYKNLDDAIKAVKTGETITLCADIEDAKGISVDSKTEFIIDFNNHTYTVNKPGAGSTGTQTQAFQLLAGQTITFKNGTINASEDNLTEAVSPAKNIKRFFQNYANVTFENMTIDGTNIYGNNSLAEFANGTVSIAGNTSFNARSGVNTITVDTWKGAYKDGAHVTIDTTGSMGDIYCYTEGSGNCTKSTLTIKNGTFGSVTTDGSEDYVISISGGSFTDLASAVKYAADDATIKLADNVEGAGIFIAKDLGKNFTIDLNKKTYTCVGPQVGSTGTQTQAFHFEKGNTITIKNGTITTTEAVEKIVIQNYCDLTLEDVTLNGEQLSYSGNTYVLSNNCGNVKLTGNTSIIAKKGHYAFDACGYSNYTDGVYVTVDTTGEIKGRVELTRSTGNTENVFVTITNGTFSNYEEDFNLITVNAKDAELNITGGDFTAKYYCVAVFHDTKLNISGGEFSVTADGMVILGNGTNDPAKPNYGPNTDIKISGGTFNAGVPNETDNTCCIYHPQSGTLTITGGTFNANNGVGILMRGGNLSVSGATTFHTDGKSKGKIGDANAPLIESGFDVVIDKQCGYYDSTNITATGIDGLKKNYLENK